MTNNDDMIMLIDESYREDYCAVCIVCIQGKENYELCLKCLPEILSKGGKSFHYNKDDIDLKKRISLWISKLPISSYIGIVKKVDLKQNKSELDKFTYKIIFPELLKPLGVKYKNRLGKEMNGIIKFENLTDKISLDLKLFQEVVDKIPDYKKMEVKVETKNSEPLNFLPDYFLGFIGHYSKDEWFKRSMYDLGEKIGLILVVNENCKDRYKRGEEVINFLNKVM